MTKNRISAPPAPLPENSGADRMAFVLLPRFNLATLITLIEPLRIANYLASRPLYQWEILSPEGPEVPASNGLSITSAPLDDRNRRGEVVFLLGSWGAEDYAGRALLAWLRRHSREGARLYAVELGAYPMARAGLLTGRQVAMHWSWAPGFQERHPDIQVTEQLFTTGDGIQTCAGGTAGIDLMLRLITDRHGEGMAGEIADQMLYQPIRPATAPQRRTPGEGTDQFAPVLRQAIALIEANIADPLPVPEIADRLGLSQRQLERQFRRGLGCSVVQFGTLVRLQHARVLLIATRLSVREIATATGFNALSHFTSAFRKCFDRRPSDYRQGWAPSEPAPSWPGTLTAYLEALRQRTTRAVRGGASSFDFVSAPETRARSDEAIDESTVTRKPG